MEWTHIVIWIVCIATGMNTFTLFRLRGSGVSRIWFLLHAGVFLLTIGLLLVSKTVAATVGGSLWTIVILMPSLLTRWISRLANRQRYTLAYRLSLLLRILHPTQVVKNIKIQMEAFSYASAGDVQHATACLEKLLPNDNEDWSGYRYLIHYLRMDWSGLLQRIAFEETLGPLRSEQYYWKIRSLSESGRFEEAVDIHQQMAEQFAGDTYRMKNEIDLVLFSYGGQIELVKKMFAGPLSDWSRHHEALWTGIAYFAGGETEKGYANLDTILKKGRGLVLQRAIRLKDGPPQSAMSLLGEEHSAYVQSVAYNTTKELNDQVLYMAPAARHRFPIATVSFVVLCCLGFYWEIHLGGWRGTEDIWNLLQIGAMVPFLVIEKGEVWRLFSFPFLHFGWMHLVLNMVALLLFGPFVERILGFWRFVLLYLFSSVGGGLLIVMGIVWFGGAKLQYAAYIGASGAVMGMVGATLAMMIKGWLAGAPAKKQILVLLFIVVLQTIFDFTTPNISVGAHWGGLLLGFGFTYLFGKLHQKKLSNVET